MGLISNAILAEKKQLVKALFDKTIILINREINMAEFKTTYFPNEDRTLCLIIKGLEDLDTGFVFRDGHVRTIKKIEDHPTVTIGMTEDTFIALCVGSLTMAEAFFYGYFDPLEGDNYLRDMEIFQRMFNAHGTMIKGKLRGG